MKLPLHLWLLFDRLLLDIKEGVWWWKKFGWKVVYSFLMDALQSMIQFARVSKKLQQETLTTAFCNMPVLGKGRDCNSRWVTSFEFHSSSHVRHFALFVFYRPFHSFSLAVKKTFSKREEWRENDRKLPKEKTVIDKTIRMSHSKAMMSTCLQIPFECRKASHSWILKWKGNRKTIVMMTRQDSSWHRNAIIVSHEKYSQLGT